MLKRSFDILVSLISLSLASPVLSLFILLVWLQDFKSPFYRGMRVGQDGKHFAMLKMRSMVVNADKSGVDSTSTNDLRITKVGHLIRRYKIDELTQLWNVLKGDMSLVGPRPNVQRDVDLYTEAEKILLSARPGITDFSSIVFADEGDILIDKEDPDLSYNQIIRPWKSRLGLLYVEKRSFWIDIKLIFYTVLNSFSRSQSLDGIQEILTSLRADSNLINIAKREGILEPFPPPGASDVVQAR